MKKFLMIAIASLLLTGHAVAQDSWIQKASLADYGNEGTYGCSIGNKAYVLRGSIRDVFGRFQTNEIWAYDPVTDVWTQKANTPEPVQNYGLAMAIGSKGYFALSGGIWEYDPAVDVWTRKLILPAGVTSFSTGFTIGGKGYFGWGTGTQLWEYDPAANSWAQKADFPSTNTGSGFSIGNKGYVVIRGVATNNIYDVWEYDPVTNNWAQKTSFGGTAVNGPNNFNLDALSSNGVSAGGKGYLATVYAVIPYQFGGYFWEYDPAIDKWTRRNLPFGGRLNAIAFSMGDKPYLGFGLPSYRSGAPIAHDLWEYTPLSVTPSPITGTGTGLQGVYYKGTQLTNTPILTRVDTTINFQFTYASIPQVLSPAPGIIPDDRYSVRWTGQVQPQYSETYTFYTKSDDGIRLWVNGVQLVDDWMNQDATEKSGSISLTAGQLYDIVIEYYENTGNAVTQLFWSGANTIKSIVPKSQLYPPTVRGTGLQGVYFNGISLSGTPLLTRIDPTINFELTYSTQPQVLSPAPGIVPDDKYSVRWTGRVEARYSETYTFYTQADDGVRLWVNGVQLVDNWQNQDATEKSGSIALVAGQQYDIVMEYYENTGNAVAKLLWSGASTPKTIVPQPQLFPPASNARLINTAATQIPQVVTTSSNISPNPVALRNPVKLAIKSDKTAAVLLTVTGSNGQIMDTRRLNLAAGVNTIALNTAGFVRGWYIVSIGEGSSMQKYKLLVQ